MKKERSIKFYRMRKISGRILWSLTVVLVLTVGFSMTDKEVSAQQILQENQTYASRVLRDSGQPVIPTYEGWFPNPEGTFTLCFGYFNLNMKQALDIPLSDLNKLEGVDDGVVATLTPPTHFDPTPLNYRRKFCVFTVTVPADFGLQDRVVWHLGSDGQIFKAEGHLLPPFFLDEPITMGRLKKAPIVTISQGEESVRGRKGVHSDNEIAAVAGKPVELSIFKIESEHDKVWVGWSKYSGPGEVQFSKAEYEIEGSTVVSTKTEATFSQPGQYIINLQAIESIADFEFFCCHTNAYLQVNVSN